MYQEELNWLKAFEKKQLSVSSFVTKKRYRTHPALIVDSNTALSNKKINKKGQNRGGS
jgi:hypothetical protein